MTNVDPAASAATSRSMAMIASRVRYMLTPVDVTIAGRPASKPAAASSPPRATRFEVDRYEAQPLGHAVAEIDQSLALPGLGARLVDLEHA